MNDTERQEYVAGSQPMVIQPAKFDKPKTGVSGIDVQYRVAEDRVQFQLYPDPKFPKYFGNTLKRVVRDAGFNEYIIDFVPEANSWYVALPQIPMGWTALAVDQFAKKLAKHLNGKVT